MIELAVKAKNFKSIGGVEQGFDAIYPINVIIGRNNSGKSTLLDLINCVIEPSQLSRYIHNGSGENEILLTKPLSQDEISGTFPRGTRGGQIGINHHDYGMQWLSKPITIRLNPDGRMTFVQILPDMDKAPEYKDKLAQNFYNFFRGKIYRRIRADRDIMPEKDVRIDVSDNGAGSTNIIQHFYIKADRNRDVITKKLLAALNEIFNPDVVFKEIIVRQDRDSVWEIYLEEEKKGLVPLSESGSGIKTVILVLINLLIMPIVGNIPINNHIFAFEELENNLHPGLQRRLFNYIRNVALNNKTHFFLTTHSNVVIDLFNKDPNAQIIHVSHNGEASTTKKVTTYIDNRGVMDDLDIRASDLLQSNSIIWVEGPSDRLYINKWISLFDPDLKEGVHYQCVFYGGRLLSHLSALQEEAKEEKGIDILKINCHAILVMDSDKKKSDDNLNKSKKRMIQEIKSAGGYIWVTKGREIENYLPLEVLNGLFAATTFPVIPDFDKFSDYLDKQIAGEGGKFLESKVLFAEKASSMFTAEQINLNAELKTELTQICNSIRNWNSMPIIK